MQKTFGFFCLFLLLAYSANSAKYGGIIANYASGFFNPVRTDLNMSTYTIYGSDAIFTGNVIAANFIGNCNGSGGSSCNCSWSGNITGYGTAGQFAFFTNSSNIASQAITTDNVSEGSNLYYTNTRARAALSAGLGINYSQATGVIAFNESWGNATYYLASNPLGFTQYTATNASNDLDNATIVRKNSSNFIINAKIHASNVSNAPWLTAESDPIYTMQNSTIVRNLATAACTYGIANFSLSQGTSSVTCAAQQGTFNTAQAPLNATGSTIGHQVSGISAGTYGSATTVPVCAFNAWGHATSCTNTNIAIPVSQLTDKNNLANTHTHDASNISNAPWITESWGNATYYLASNPLGFTQYTATNASNDLDNATIVRKNSSNFITNAKIHASNVSNAPWLTTESDPIYTSQQYSIVRNLGTDTCDYGIRSFSLWYDQAFVECAEQQVGIVQDAYPPIYIDKGFVGHQESGISKGVYGSQSYVPVCNYNEWGHATECFNVQIQIGASQITSGVLPIARGGTNANSYGTNNVLYFDGTRIANKSTFQFTPSTNSLFVNGTISTNTSFKVGANNGLTINLRVNGTTKQCWMNFTGGLLTASDCPTS